LKCNECFDRHGTGLHQRAEETPGPIRPELTNSKQYGNLIRWINKKPMKWEEKNNQLEKEFTFNNFVEAIDFVNRVKEPAEAMQHHPDIFIHSYKKVRITLTTHSEGHVTLKDHELAGKIDELA
jgi:4a-hydroxytetrahydrobiopterin dehydratase